MVCQLRNRQAHFGTIDVEAKVHAPDVARYEVGVLDLARCWDRIYFWPCDFLENGSSGFETKAVPSIELFVETRTRRARRDRMALHLDFSIVTASAASLAGHAAIE